MHKSMQQIPECNKIELWNDKGNFVGVKFLWNNTVIFSVAMDHQVFRGFMALGSKFFTENPEAFKKTFPPGDVTGMGIKI